MREKRKPKKKAAPASRWDVRVDLTKSVFQNGANGTGSRGAKVTVTDLQTGDSLQRFVAAHTKNEVRRESEQIVSDLKAELTKHRR